MFIGDYELTLEFDLNEGSSAVFSLPEIYEPNDDLYYEFVKISDKASFIVYDKVNRTLVLEDMQLGEYEVKVTLIDELQAKREYTFDIIITKPSLF